MEFNGIINNGDTLSGFNHLLWIMDEHIPDDLNVKHGDFQFATLNNQRVTNTLPCLSIFLELEHVGT
jgi:hypothetical protein